MIPALLPVQERDRLEALLHHHASNTQTDQEFEELTQLISQIYGAPVSLKTLLEVSKEWLDHTPALSVHAVLTEALEPRGNWMPDSHFADDTRTGLDSPAHPLTEPQKVTLRTLTRQLITGMELKLQLLKVTQAYAELEKRKKVVEEKNRVDLHYSKQFQQALLTNGNEFHAHLPESFLLQRSRNVVSGDFYYVAEDKHTGKILVAVADCTGHDVRGAFTSVLGNALLNQIVKVRGVVAPDEILNQLQTSFQQSSLASRSGDREGMEIAVCVIDREKQVLEFAGAGRELFVAEAPLSRAGGATIRVVKGDRMGIGGMHPAPGRKFTKHVVPFHARTAFYMFTDGLTNQLGGPSGTKFSKTGFHKWLVANATQPFLEQELSLHFTLDQWANREMQTDDALIVAFRAQP